MNLVQLTKRKAPGVAPPLRPMTAPGLPNTVHVSLTNRCNLLCRMCELPLHPEPVNLKLDDWKAIIDKLHAWLGPFTLKIAGGEPLVKKFTPELIGHARSLGLFVGMSSNAMLIDARMAERLAENRLSEINVSIDSLRPAYHDFVRGEEGAYAGALRGIRNLLEVRGDTMELNIATVISRGNVHELVDMAWWAKENRFRTITYQPILATFGQEYRYGWHAMSDLWPDRLDYLNEVLDQLAEFRRKYWTVGNAPEQIQNMKYYFANPYLKPPTPCTAGQNDIHVNPLGKMSLCPNLWDVGDLNHLGPGEAWVSAAAETRRDEIYHCDRNCYLLNCVNGE